MGISLKHDEYERMIRRLAVHRGTSLTDTIGAAVRNELVREGLAPDGEHAQAFTTQVRRIQNRVKSYRIDPRSANEIIGYDEHGLST